MLQTSVNKLIIQKMSIDAIPQKGGLVDGLKFLSNTNNISAGLKKAKEWVENAIITVRLATEPNLWKNSTDEEIAQEILNKINEKRNRRV